MRDKIVRRLPSWQRPGVVSQQRFRLRRLTLVKRVPKLRFESFCFIPIFSLFSCALLHSCKHRLSPLRQLLYNCPRIRLTTNTYFAKYHVSKSHVVLSLRDSGKTLHFVLLAFPSSHIKSAWQESSPVSNSRAYSVSWRLTISVLTKVLKQICHRKTFFFNLPKIAFLRL